MGTAMVQVAGTWVSALFPHGDVEHSSMWLVDDPSGDDEAQISLSCPPGLEAPWTLPGQPFEIWSPSGGLLWGGVTEEPERDASGITLVAHGVAWELEKWMAQVPVIDLGYNNEDGYLPTFIPNEAVDAAEADGAPFSRHGVDLGDESVAEADEEEKLITVGEVLRRAAISQGKRVHVDSTGAITFRADPGSPTLVVDPDRVPYMGTSDALFVSSLSGWFKLTPDSGDPGSGTDWKPFVYKAEDSDAARKFGVSQRSIDLENLGLLTYAAGQAYVAGRFALVGGRMGWTTAVNLSRYNLRHANGAWFDPRWVKAGTKLQLPGIVDSRSQPTIKGAIEIVLSRVRIVEGDRPTGRAEPVGFTPRDFNGALAKPEKPALKETA